MKNRLPLIDPAAGTGKLGELLNSVHGKLGFVPNMMRGMANSPAALDGYLSFSGALARGSLNAKMREQIALAVAEDNECEYCLAAHSALGAKAGLHPADLEAARTGSAADTRAAAALALARAIVRTRGEVADADLRAARSAGLTDGEIAEVIANVALNVFTNYFNRLAATPLDFPRVPQLQSA